MDTLNKRTVRIIGTLLLSTLAFAQTGERVVARLDYLKLLAGRYNELSEQIDRATIERTRIEGQITLLQAIKNDSLIIPVQ